MRPLEIERPLAVRTYDIDFAGIVGNIVYLRWLEEMRLAVLEVSYPLADLLRDDLAPTLVETRISYRRPITLSDRPVARMWISDMGRVRFTFSAEIQVEGEIATRSEQVACLVHMTRCRPVPLPPRLRAAYAACAGEA